jgi:glycine cleavage system aminomethyltransferase T/glycine/D-amino acid oxidase-like deaminating enzyme
MDGKVPSQARAVVIGGGIVGCSLAYHLTRLGWRDVVVLDQGPLPQNWGSTSHAPGLMFQHNVSRTVCQLAQWSVATYREVDLPTSPAVFPVGSLEVAETAERWAELKRRVGQARAWGLEAHLIEPDEVKRRFPPLRTDDLHGALFVPGDCAVKTVALLGALMARAGERGATFHAGTAVTGIEVRNGQVRAVETAAGRIVADVVISAAGMWGPLVGNLVEVKIPLTPLQHVFARSGPLPELAGETAFIRLPFIRYQDHDGYLRQYADAIGFGSYRHEPRPVEPAALPRPAMLPAEEADFDVAWNDAVARIPALRDTDIVERFNGLFSFTPDGNAILGESPDVRGFWAAEAVWITHAGGAAKVVAEWLVNGRPSIDLREVDLNRFQPHALGKRYVWARSTQGYREVYDIIHPGQQMEFPRPLRVSPFYQRQKELAAHFFENAGWERPQWYGVNAKLLAEGASWPARSGWTAQNWSPIIGAEHLAVRARVGLFDLTPFGKIDVAGPGALAYLQKLTANQIDQPIGRITYTAMLDEAGTFVADLTVTRLGPQHFRIITAGSTLYHDLAWLRQHLPSDGSVQLHDVSSAYCCLGLWGPRARDVAQSASDDDWSNEAFPYFRARPMTIGFVPVRASRISYVGELGWEIYAPTEFGLALWDTLWSAGQAFGIVAAGSGCFETLRLEKGYRLWGAEIHTDYTPDEAGLGFAVRLSKGDFLGRSAVERLRAAGVRRKLCCLTLEDPSVVVMGKEPIYSEDESAVLGYVTSANYGYSVGQSSVYGYLPTEFAQVGTKVKVYFFGELHSATVTKEPLFDPNGRQLKC